MTLKNLVGKSIEEISVDQATIELLISAAERNIQDSKIVAVSLENRFDSAYKAIMQIANAALQGKGFRTLTSVPGHHATMIRSLEETLVLERKKIILLDSLRKQRNIADYCGDPVSEIAVKECIKQAELLLKRYQDFCLII